MKYFYVKIRGLKTNCSMKEIYNIIPKDKIEEIGFICSCCETYILDNTNKLCNLCSEFENPQDRMHEFVIGSNDKDLIINFSKLSNKSKNIYVNISSDFDMTEDITSTLQPIKNFS